MKINVEELTMQIKIALQDVFEAQISCNDKTISLVFENGQQFSLLLAEK